MSSKKQLLFCPGPVQLAASVKQAAFDNEIGHREPQFSELLESINSKLLTLFHIGNSSTYRSVVITGSGTAANECVLSSIGNRKILVISNGEFGERLAHIATFHHKAIEHYKLAWGQEIHVAEIEKVVTEKNIDFVAMVHHETSTGMKNPIEALGAMLAKYKVWYMVDAVSSAGAEDIDIARVQCTFMTTSASKAIGSHPGVSMVVGTVEAFESLKEVAPKTVYLDLYKFYDFAVSRAQTPNTPAVQSFFALNQALDNIIRHHKEHFARQATLAHTMREGLSALGFTFMLPPEQQSVVLTNVSVPETVSVDAIKDGLRKRGIVIYDGKGPLSGKVFQVSTIGNLSDSQTSFFLKNIKEVMRGLKAVTTSKIVRSPFSIGELLKK